MIQYLERFFKGLFGAALSDPTPDPAVTSLLVGSVAVAKRTDVATGAAVFFLGYATFANIANLAASVRFLKPPPVSPHLASSAQPSTGVIGDR